MSNRPPCHPTFALAKREESIYGLAQRNPTNPPCAPLDRQSAPSQSHVDASHCQVDLALCQVHAAHWQVNASLCQVHASLWQVHGALCQVDPAHWQMHASLCQMHASLWQMHGALCQVDPALCQVHAALCQSEPADCQDQRVRSARRRAGCRSDPGLTPCASEASWTRLPCP